MYVTWTLEADKAVGTCSMMVAPGEKPMQAEWVSQTVITVKVCDPNLLMKFGTNKLEWLLYTCQIS